MQLWLLWFLLGGSEKNQVFLPRGYKGKKKIKKDGEENSFPCLVLFISNGMKQSGLRACLDGGLWHWCGSRSVVKSVQVPNAAHSSRRSLRDAKPPCKVRGLHALQNPSLGEAMQPVCTGDSQTKFEKLLFFFLFIYQSAPKQHYQHNRAFDQLKYFNNCFFWRGHKWRSMKNC